MEQNIKVKITYLLYSLIIFNCSMSISKNRENELYRNSDYGFFKFTNSIIDGRLSLKTVIFKNVNNCFSDSDCSGEDSITMQSNLGEGNPSVAISLDVGKYYAISKLRFTEVLLFDCKVSYLKIYHGFTFKEKIDLNESVNFYTAETCEFTKPDTAICPQLIISKRGINEIELKKGDIRSNSLSIRHLVAPWILSPLALLYCGPFSDDVDFIAIKNNRFEEK